MNRQYILKNMQPMNNEKWVSCLFAGNPVLDKLLYSHRLLYITGIVFWGNAFFGIENVMLIRYNEPIME